jgi:hypothetical protein
MPLRRNEIARCGARSIGASTSFYEDGFWTVAAATSMQGRRGIVQGVKEQLSVVRALGGVVLSQPIFVVLEDAQKRNGRSFDSPG